MIRKIVLHINCFVKKTFLKIMYLKKLSVGQGLFFRRGFILNINQSGCISIGDNCFFNNYCSLNAHKSIKIGSNCTFGEGCRIYDHDHKYRNKERHVDFLESSIVIEDNCWIGSGTTILKGVHIGEGAVVGAGTVVHFDVPAYTVVVSDVKPKFIAI